jgi:hypothetical protein
MRGQIGPDPLENLGSRMLILGKSSQSLLRLLILAIGTCLRLAAVCSDIFQGQGKVYNRVPTLHLVFLPSTFLRLPGKNTFSVLIQQKDLLIDESAKKDFTDIYRTSFHFRWILCLPLASANPGERVLNFLLHLCWYKLLPRAIVQARKFVHSTGGARRNGGHHDHLPLPARHSSESRRVEHRCY